MTGLPADNNPLGPVFFNPKSWIISPLELTADAILTAVTKLEDSLRNMHKEILETTQDQRSRQRDSFSRNRALANLALEIMS